MRETIGASKASSAASSSKRAITGKIATRARHSGVSRTASFSVVTSLRAALLGDCRKLGQFVLGE